MKPTNFDLITVRRSNKGWQQTNQNKRIANGNTVTRPLSEVQK